MTRIGYQIPNFTHPGVGPAELFDVVAKQAAAADRSGFDTVMVMDHFYQLPMLGDPSKYMLECYSTLAALAQHTKNVRLGALVTGNTYRNPALLAKTITTLDIVSGGRAQLGIGAGWFELEHDSLGFEFGTFTERFEKLEEALQIIIPMLRDERPTFTGAHYSVENAINQPPPISRIPIMIGGSGEKKTLRMVAQYADEANFTCGLDEVPRKMDALAAHCERLGRDRSEIVVSKMGLCVIAPTMDQAYQEAKGFMLAMGVDLDAVDEATREMYLSLVWWGDSERIEEWFVQVKDMGLDGVTVSLPANGIISERVEQLGEVAVKVFGRSN